MFRHVLIACLAFCASNICAAQAGDRAKPFRVGQLVREFRSDTERNWRGATMRALRTTIWFPTDRPQPEQAHDTGPPGNPCFRGHPLAVGAALSPARKTFPLVILSHGTGGGADALDWLAAPLAAAGYVVAAVDHPGNNALEPLTWDGFTLWWERATDLSQMLDGILADPTIGTRIDRDRIAAVGFSLGGYSVLELAGARTNFAAFQEFCKSPAADATCHPPEMDRVVDRPSESAAPSAERKASLARSGASFKDRRVKAVVAIAPAVGQAFDRRSFDDVDIPVRLLAGSGDVHVPPNTNVQHVASLLPGAQLIMLSGAGHYTFLPVCERAMTQRMPMLCEDGPNVDRGAIHARTIREVSTFLGRTIGITNR